MENNELKEIDETNKTAKCTHCITACAASLDSEGKQQIDEDAAIDGNAVFLQKVYKNENIKNIELDFCKEPLTPAIVYDGTTSNFEIGYEVNENFEKNCFIFILNAKKGLISFECWLLFLDVFRRRKYWVTIRNGRQILEFWKSKNLLIIDPIGARIWSIYAILEYSIWLLIFLQVIEGESPEWKQLPKTKHVVAEYDEENNLKFNLEFDGSKQIFVSEVN